MPGMPSRKLHCPRVTVDTLPCARRVLVRFRQRRVDVDRAEDLVQAQTVLHRQHVLGDQVARVLADDGDTENPVGARMREHLDQSVGFPVGDGAVQVVDTVDRHGMRNVPFLRLGFVQSDARDFRLGERGPGNHAVVGLEPAKGSEQCIDRRVPRLVRSRVRELVGTGNVTAGVDVRIDRLQVVIGLEGACLRRTDAEFLQSVALGVGHAADGDEHRVERDADLVPGVLGDQHLLAVVDERTAWPCAR